MRINGISSSSVEAVVGDQMIEFTLINKLITFFRVFLPSEHVWFTLCRGLSVILELLSYRD